MKSRWKSAKRCYCRSVQMENDEEEYLIDEDIEVQIDNKKLKEVVIKRLMRRKISSGVGRRRSILTIYLTLLNTAYKVYPTVLAERLRKNEENERIQVESQAGFRTPVQVQEGQNNEYEQHLYATYIMR